jgi:hypothetical protein
MSAHRGLSGMSVRMRIALATLCVFNALTLAAMGLLAALYLEPQGRVVAGGLWAITAALVLVSRWLRKATDWR